LSDQYNVDASVTDPVNTISGPIRLAGRCHHATSPLTVYDNAIQRISAACTGAMSLSEMIASEPPKPTSSTTVMNHNRTLGPSQRWVGPALSGSSASFTTFPTEGGAVASYLSRRCRLPENRPSKWPVARLTTRVFRCQRDWQANRTKGDPHEDPSHPGRAGRRPTRDHPN
jgi:hypothetical protein